MDRQSGYVKGYVLVEFEKLEDAMRTVREGNDQELLGRRIQLDFAIVEGDLENEGRSRDSERERSPTRYGSLV